MKGLAVLFFWVFVAFLVWVIVAKKKGGPMKIQLIVCIAAFALFAYAPVCPAEKARQPRQNLPPQRLR